MPATVNDLPDPFLLAHGYSRQRSQALSGAGNVSMFELRMRLDGR